MILEGSPTYLRKQDGSDTFFVSFSFNFFLTRITPHTVLIDSLIYQQHLEQDYS